jgi:transcriptional regulator with XRE-family HTH domain
MMKCQSFGKTIQQIRRHHRKGLRSTALKAGISHVSLLNLENGKIKVKPETAYRLARTLAEDDQGVLEILKLYEEGINPKHSSTEGMIELLVLLSLRHAGLKARLSSKIQTGKGVQNHDICIDLGDGLVGLIEVKMRRLY